MSIERSTTIPRETCRCRRDFTVSNPLGLHARPAAEFVRTAQTIRSEVWIVHGHQRYNAGRLMDLLLANLDCGATFTLEAIGPDAEQALDRIETLLVEIREAEARGAYA